MTSGPFPQNSTAALLIFLLLALCAIAADKPAEVKGGNGIILPPPPATETKPVTEDIHGTTLTDPYRWLEDAKSPATRAFPSSAAEIIFSRSAWPTRIRDRSIYDEACMARMSDWWTRRS